MHGILGEILFYLVALSVRDPVKSSTVPEDTKSTLAVGLWALLPQARVWIFELTLCFSKVLLLWEVPDTFDLQHRIANGRRLRHSHPLSHAVLDYQPHLESGTWGLNHSFETKLSSLILHWCFLCLWVASSLNRKTWIKCVHWMRLSGNYFNFSVHSWLL